ncbi:thermosensitive gluconokinase [Plectosphaerella plurivora]|uniref:gluconokinase n=1 Tax=Plectosphaerella plurivora TaxID=936078 RepID=A0A9P9A6A1_9PEZI|nr:thermosensitive gluconokinase [Plectosphaerella plurivora]
MSPPSVYGPTGITEPLASPIQPTSLTESAPVQEDDSTITTVDELVRRRARADPDSIIVSYPSSGIDYVDYTMRQLDVFAYRAAKVYQQHIPSRKSSDEKPLTVAILGPSNFEYLVTMLALTKLGYTTLFLSTRISQEAVDNLINLTGAQYLITDARFVDTAKESQKALPSLGIMEIVGRSAFEFSIEVHADTRMDYHLDPAVEANNLIYIIHSSGSTGLPKPIYQTQKSAVANYAFSMEMKAFITLPLYHNHGICNLFRAIYCRKPIHLYNADLPLTHEYLTKIMRAHRFEIFYGVPYALKLLSESDEGMALLRDLKIVMYGGSACPDDLGNGLVDAGVNLVGHYGATEVGQLMTSFRPPDDRAWNYVRESPKLSPFLRWVPRGPGLFECVVLDGWPSKVAASEPDGSYATKDLFEPHPTIPRAWRYVARRDDTIALVNGEKFNPVSTEGAIRSSKHVAEAVIFGAGRPALGVLVVPAESLAGKTEAETLDTIWPVVEAACRGVEAYARISRSMIRLLPAGCDYPRTDKGSVIRQAFYKRYAAEIDETYDRADTVAGELQAMSPDELREFVRQILVAALARQVPFDDDTDFFSLGLDSLQAIQMRSEILKTVDVGGKKLGQTVVFDNPSVARLATYLHGLRGETQTDATAAVEDEMKSLIDKYALQPASPAATSSSSVAVTGATGSLGAHVVAKLASDPSISTIYCLVRARSDEEAAKRVRASLVQRRVYHSLPLDQRRKLISLASDLSNAHLGLSEDVYASLRQNLRTAIHCAWSVNFNMRLSSFEKSNVAGVANLIALCRAAGPSASLNFCSSVSTVVRSTVVPIPETVPDLEWAQGMGYAQSKSVAEHLCARAAEQGVTARVLRVGQIVADTTHGVWNSTEAIPLMLQSAITVGALPRLRETPSWLPVDTVAAAVAEISLSDAGSVFTNVTNPKLFDWTNDLLPALKKTGLEFEEVEPKEWVRRLRASEADPALNPPIKLVDFFASKYDKDEFVPPKAYATDVACSLAPALANAPVLDQGLVDSFVSCFLAGPWAAPGKPKEKTAKSVIFVAGPCGSGKSTLAASLAQKLAVPFIEGDSLHSRASIAKMAASEALTDDDRVSWLTRLGRRAVESVVELGYDSVVVSCSALRTTYRDALRKQVGDVAQTVFLDLQCEPEVLLERVEGREGHYMAPSMVEGQVSVHEEPAASEADVFPVDGGSTPEQVLEESWWLLGQRGISRNE